MIRTEASGPAKKKPDAPASLLQHLPRQTAFAVVAASLLIGADS